MCGMSIGGPNTVNNCLYVPSPMLFATQEECMATLDNALNTLSSQKPDDAYIPLAECVPIGTKT